ncbi:MAG: NADase-type glycan-binding domain-containing protein [Terracidiphilus sp.]
MTAPKSRSTTSSATPGPAVDVRAGFPSLGVQLEDVPHQEIERYTLYADGQPVASATESGDPTPFKRLFDAKFRQMGELDEYPPEKRPELLEWLVSTVHFDAGQSRHIHLSYDSLYANCGGGYSDDSDDCDDRFAYVLSTAAAWKGPIAEGHVSIEAITVPAERLILSPVGRFHRKGSTYSWEFRNLKPSPSDDILVSLNNHASTIAEYVEGTGGGALEINYYTLEAGRYFYMNRRFVPDAESASREYSASQLRKEGSDQEWRTVHAPGIGDVLTLGIVPSAHVNQVGIIPGCGSKEQDWFRHARVKEVELTVNHKYARSTILPDEFTFPWPESHKAYEWIDLPPYPGEAETIRLVIHSTYPGSTDQVTCIRKVMLRQWLKSRPTIKSGVDGHELP